MLAKIDVWFSSRKVQKAMEKINPRYLERSPVNILSATKFMTQPLLNRNSSHTEAPLRAFSDFTPMNSAVHRTQSISHDRPQFVRERPDHPLILFPALNFM